MNEKALADLSLHELEVLLAANPGKAELHYLVGAELAQSQDYHRAVIELGTALSLNPNLPYARFQLGLLHLTLAHPESAQEVWGPLEKLPAESPLRLFKQGLEALIVDDFERCESLLGRGIATNAENLPLNRDMQLVIDRLRVARASAPPPVSEPLGDSKPAANADDVRTDFSKYGSVDPKRH